ncbi:hypothetical protein MJO29_008937 [Puccinia striiformis f. sp. tritici]|nr:hypothetical protein MJO29_008937 [Puccinia striiformis f. sp. tritici]
MDGKNKTATKMVGLSAFIFDYERRVHKKVMRTDGTQWIARMLRRDESHLHSVIAPEHLSRRYV